VPRPVARRPNYHHHSIRKKSDGLETRLAIIPSCVLRGNRRTSKDDGCVSKIQTPVVESRLTFCRVECDFHIIKRTPNNIRSQLFGGLRNNSRARRALIALPMISLNKPLPAVAACCARLLLAN
jgi:hypothetical protein